MYIKPVESAALVTSKVDFFVNVLGVFSTILLGVFTILAAILGYLVWRNEEMKKKAQTELEKIKAFALETESNSKKVRLASEAVNAEVISLATTSAAFGKLLGSAKTDSKEISEIRDAAKKYDQEIKEAGKSLATISENIPSPSASPSVSPSMSPPTSISTSISSSTSPSTSPRTDDLVRRAMRARILKLRGENSNETKETHND